MKLKHNTLLEDLLEVPVSFVFMMVLLWLCVVAGLIYLGVII